MRWRNTSDQAIRWPGGELRAAPGEVFEDFAEGAGVTAVQARMARSWLTGDRHRIVGAPGEQITAKGNEMPEELFNHVRSMNRGVYEARTAAEDAPADQAQLERLSDPHE